MHANQSVGQANVVTSSRGKPKGKSNPPIQGPGVCKAKLKDDKASQCDK
jgi:hypothetical protein